MGILRWLVLIVFACSSFAQSARWKVIAWNDLGMHCMDADYSVFAILPPFNTIHAQVIDPSGRLVRNAGAVTVTYEGVADPDGSVNSTSVGKTNFWSFVQSLFGASPDPDTGLTGQKMPGAGNTPQLMKFEPERNWFTAEGIPITAYDDAGNRNTYPLLKVVVRDSEGAVLASTSIVAPVSDEMSCKACHGSGTEDPDPEKDYRLAILKSHDRRRQDQDAYKRVLTGAGYTSDGLYLSATRDAKPVLCAACHSSNALGTAGAQGVAPLTRAIHASHASKRMPGGDLALDDQNNREACYACHPGSATRCLRGAMGKSTAADGSMRIQCQSCHGNMSRVGSEDRQGWLGQPGCQACHSGTAVANGGEIRFLSVFDAAGQERAPADNTFATNPGVPAPGLSLFRLSAGHGGLQCQACHGSTHAEYPSSQRNDNLQSIALQGYEGKLIECTACHAGSPNTTTGGPHGMHPVGQVWLSGHERPAERDAAPCRACHGLDYRGTVLSAVPVDRALGRNRNFSRGTRIGCYNCHNGPRG